MFRHLIVGKNIGLFYFYCNKLQIQAFIIHILPALITFAVLSTY